MSSLELLLVVMYDLFYALLSICGLGLLCLAPCLLDVLTHH